MQTIATTHGEIKTETKTDRIRTMLFHGFSAAEIAAEVGCSGAYVRAIRNRLRNKLQTGRTAYPNERVLIDEAYRKQRSEATSARHAERRRSDPAYRERCRERHNARFVERYRSDPDFRERRKEQCREYQRRRRAAKAEAAL